MKILAVDTSSKYGSIALSHHDLLIAEIGVYDRICRDESLIPAIQNLLDMVGWTVRDMDGFVVTLGPGAFTGLRIGLATVQGLGSATGKPTLGLPSLQALAMAHRSCRLPICSVIEARRGEVYAALFQFNGDHLEEKMPEQAISPDKLLSQLEGEILFTGDGASFLIDALPAFPAINAIMADRALSMCRAGIVALWAYREFCVHPETARQLLTPRYVLLPGAYKVLPASP